MEMRGDGLVRIDENIGVDDTKCGMSYGELKSRMASIQLRMEKWMGRKLQLKDVKMIPEKTIRTKRTTETEINRKLSEWRKVQCDLYEGKTKLAAGALCKPQKALKKDKDHCNV